MPGWCSHILCPRSSGGQEAQCLGQEAEPHRIHLILGSAERGHGSECSPGPGQHFYGRLQRWGSSCPCLGNVCGAHARPQPCCHWGSSADCWFFWLSPSCTISSCNHPAGMLPVPLPWPQHLQADRANVDDGQRAELTQHPGKDSSCGALPTHPVLASQAELDSICPQDTARELCDTGDKEPSC